MAGFLTRAQHTSTHTFSSGSTAGPIHEIGEYAFWGLLCESTGAVPPSFGFAVTASTSTSGTFYPLMDEAATAVTVTISTTTLQAYALPDELAAWKRFRLTSTAGTSTTQPYVLFMKG